MKRPWPNGGLSRKKHKNNVRKGNSFVTQYNLKPLISQKIDDPFGKLMADQFVASVYQ